MGAPIYNKSCIFGRYDFPIDQASCTQSCATAAQVLAACNYDITQSFFEDSEYLWTKDDLRGAIHFSTSGHILTHGNYDNGHGYLEALTPHLPTLSQMLSGPEIESSKQTCFHYSWPSWQPFYLPPFNNTVTGPGPGPINIILIDGCSVGQDYSFLNSLLCTWTNAYSYPWIEDQAAVGWNGLISQTNAAARSSVFWNSLKEGKTVSQAAIEMYHSEQFVPYPYQYNAEEVVVGDLFARLHGVYTGSNLLAPNWWWQVGTGMGGSE